MKISLKEFFLSLSSLLDFLEIDLISEPTNHCKRVAYISLRLGKMKGLNDKELFILGSLAILHDLGGSKAALIQKMKENNYTNIESLPSHAEAGADLVKELPFLENYSDVILYHHERYDGKGIYKVKGESIPLFSRIIHISDIIEIHLSDNKQKIEQLISILLDDKGTFFDPSLTDMAVSFLRELESNDSLCDSRIIHVTDEIYPDFIHDVTDDGMYKMAKAFSVIVDAKSPFTQNHSIGLAEKTEILSSYYGFDETKKKRLVIAALLHDIGKLSVPNEILEKNGKLTEEEFSSIHRHTYYTRLALSHINGWEDITDWASDHHEKLNGKGYPIGKTAGELPFESRMMVCLDIFQALSEERPYKKGFSDDKIQIILNECVEKGEIDGDIVRDIGICLMDVPVS